MKTHSGSTRIVSWRRRRRCSRSSRRRRRPGGASSRAALEREQGADGADEGARRSPRCRSRRAPRPGSARKPSPMITTSRQREERGRARRSSAAQPCSSRSSSTSMGRRRRWIATIRPRPTRDLAGRDDHDDDREDLAVAVAVHAREGDERQVAGVEHQLQAEQDHQRVAPREHARRRRSRRRGPRRRGTSRCSSAASARAGSRSAGSRSMPSSVGGPSGRCAAVPVIAPTASAIVPVPTGRRSATSVSRSSSSSMPPRRRARTTAPTAAISSRNEATSNGSRKRVSSSSPICAGRAEAGAVRRALGVDPP